MDFLLCGEELVQMALDPESYPSHVDLRCYQAIPSPARGSTPVDALPPEILYRIFRETRGSSDPAMRSITTPPFPLTLAAVSTRWRQLAVSVPEFWTDITFLMNGSMCHPKLYLERSVPAKIDVHLEYYVSSSNEFKIALNLLLPHLERCHSIKIWGCFEDLEEFMSEFQHLRAPALETFDVRNWSQTFDASSIEAGHEPVFTAGAPHLTRLVVWDINALRCALPLEALTSLELHRGWEEIDADLLNHMGECCLSLQHLSICCSGLSSPSLTDAKDLVLPHLRSLAVDGPLSILNDFYLYFRTPLLQGLQLRSCLRHSGPFHPPRGDALHQALDQVSDLALLGVEVSLELLALIKRMPLVTLRTIRSSNVVISDICSGRGAWPALRNLVTDASCEVMAPLVRARTHAGCPLAKVCLLRMRSRAVHPQALRELSALVALEVYYSSSSDYERNSDDEDEDAGLQIDEGDDRVGRSGRRRSSV